MALNMRIKPQSTTLFVTHVRTYLANSDVPRIAAFNMWLDIITVVQRQKSLVYHAQSMPAAFAFSFHCCHFGGLLSINSKTLLMTFMVASSTSSSGISWTRTSACDDCVNKSIYEIHSRGRREKVCVLFSFGYYIFFPASWPWENLTCSHQPWIMMSAEYYEFCISCLLQWETEACRGPNQGTKLFQRHSDFGARAQPRGGLRPPLQCLSLPITPLLPPFPPWHYWISAIFSDYRLVPQRSVAIIYPFFTQTFRCDVQRKHICLTLIRQHRLRRCYPVKEPK